MRNISFTPSAFKEYNDWLKVDESIADKIIELIRDIQRESFKGIGKHEPLKGNYSGFWSRRITLEHRLIYKIETTTILIVKCEGHYE